MIAFVPVAYGYSTLAAAPVLGAGCSLSFSGIFESLQLVPTGQWRLTSSDCRVVDQSQGITSGTFTGTVTSGAASAVVSGTWSVAGSTNKVTASSTAFTLSFSVDHDLDGIPGMGSAYQGLFSMNTGPLLLAAGTAGQITFN